MFPEYRDLISRLKASDAHFARLFHEHNELDQKIKNVEDGIETAPPEAVEEMKRAKLRLKDDLYSLLRRAAPQA